MSSGNTNSAPHSVGTRVVWSEDLSHREAGVGQRTTQVRRGRELPPPRGGRRKGGRPTRSAYGSNRPHVPAPRPFAEARKGLSRPGLRGCRGSTHWPPTATSKWPSPPRTLGALREGGKGELTSSRGGGSRVLGDRPPPERPTSHSPARCWFSSWQQSVPPTACASTEPDDLVTVTSRMEGESGDDDREPAHRVPAGATNFRRHSCRPEPCEVAAPPPLRSNVTATPPRMECCRGGAGRVV